MRHMRIASRDELCIRGGKKTNRRDAPRCQPLTLSQSPSLRPVSMVIANQKEQKRQINIFFGVSVTIHVLIKVLQKSILVVYFPFKKKHQKIRYIQSVQLFPVSWSQVCKSNEMESSRSRVRIDIVQICLGLHCM